ncbi:unnamed protein product [Soboliphyme baturini]|uniref:HTH_Tnp_Tc3_2 domain-containing protein n=1 Tax=Soboliphyme baturini TaxID=241478 RepID=A0A183JAU9_9BILA|nr:unnamed protein product [Soboliphyme baturini]
MHEACIQTALYCQKEALYALASSKGVIRFRKMVINFICQTTSNATYIKRHTSNGPSLATVSRVCETPGPQQLCCRWLDADYQLLNSCHESFVWLLAEAL